MIQSSVVTGKPKSPPPEPFAPIHRTHFLQLPLPSIRANTRQPHAAHTISHPPPPSATRHLLPLPLPTFKPHAASPYPPTSAHTAPHLRSTSKHMKHAAPTHPRFHTDPHTPRSPIRFAAFRARNEHASATAPRVLSLFSLKSPPPRRRYSNSTGCSLRTQVQPLVTHPIPRITCV